MIQFGPLRFYLVEMKWLFSVVFLFIVFSLSCNFIGFLSGLQNAIKAGLFMPGIRIHIGKTKGEPRTAIFFDFMGIFPNKWQKSSPLARTFHSEKSLISQLSFTELNSLESTESIEFVEDYF